jgi:hypothetical protein
LLQRKAYGIGVPQFEQTLTDDQINWLHSDNFSFEQAEEIVNAKNYEGGAEMRGRQSYNPIEKMGLAYLTDENKIVITSFGNYFLANDYDLGNVFFRSFLKWQYPSPDANKYSSNDGYNIKPLIATFHLIKEVNALCSKKESKEKGVSRTEFALFFTTLSNYTKIGDRAKNIIEFRQEYDGKNLKAEKDKFAEEYFNKNFSEYKSWKNANEYTDNIIRYFRLTRFFYLRGNDYYIDLGVPPLRGVGLSASMCSLRYASFRAFPLQSLTLGSTLPLSAKKQVA